MRRSSATLRRALRPGRSRRSRRGRRAEAVQQCVPRSALSSRRIEQGVRRPAQGRMPEE